MKAFIYRYAFVAILCGSLLSSACMLRAQQSDQDRPTDAPSNSPSDSNRPGPPHGPPSPERELAHLTRALTLTDAQKAPILAVLQERHIKMEELMQSSTDRAAVGPQMHTIITATNAEIRALLTEPQQKIFDAMRPPHPPAHGGEEGGPPPPPDDAAPPQN